MAIGFLDLPHEVRNMIYEPALLHAEPINPWCVWDGPQRLSLQLLRVNKIVHSEASSIFYGRNCFDLINRQYGKIASFLDQIRPRNASQIEHVRVKLMVFRMPVYARNDYLLDVLAKIRSCCPDLRTLTGIPHYLIDVFDCNDPAFFPGYVSLKSNLVRAIMKRFKRLEAMIVEVSRRSLHETIQRELGEHGWTTRFVEPVDEEYPKPLFDESDDYGDRSH